MYKQHLATIIVSILIWTFSFQANAGGTWTRFSDPDVKTAIDLPSGEDAFVTLRFVSVAGAVTKAKLRCCAPGQEGANSNCNQTPHDADIETDVLFTQVLDSSTCNGQNHCTVNARDVITLGDLKVVIENAAREEGTCNPNDVIRFLTLLSGKSAWDYVLKQLTVEVTGVRGTEETCRAPASCPIYAQGLAHFGSTDTPMFSVLPDVQYEGGDLIVYDDGDLPMHGNFFTDLVYSCNSIDDPDIIPDCTESVSLPPLPSP